MSEWGKEPFDLKLTVLRLLRSLPWILAVTAAGTLLFGGIYYVKNITLRRERTFAASATFRVEYSGESWAEDGTYINYMTWNTWLDSDVFYDAFLQETGGREVTPEEFEAMTEVTVPSDLRVPVVQVTADRPERAQEILEGIAVTLTGSFPENLSEVDSIRLIDREEAREVFPDVRPKRAFLLAAVLTGFFAVVLVLLREISDERIYLPSTLTRRYGLRSTGVTGTELFAENLRYFFRDAESIAVCPAEECLDPGEIVRSLQQVVFQTRTPQWIALPCPVLTPEAADKLREADGVLLVVRAGSTNSKQLEELLDFLKAQEVGVTAAMLWDEDKWLLSNYYGRHYRQKG